MIPTSGVRENTVEVTSDTADSNPGNNDNTRSITTVAAANLGVTAASSAAAGASAGTPYQYTLTVDNSGPDALPGGQTPRVTFKVPAGAAITARPTGAGWTCTPASGYPLTSPTATITCDRTGSDTLVSGASWPDITVPVVSNVEGTVTASFAVTSQYPDGNLINNTAVLSNAFAEGSDMAITKSASPSGTVPIGTEVTFTLTPQLVSGTAPSNFTVSDTLPAGMAYVRHASSAPWNCSISGQLFSCTYEGTWNAAVGAVTVTATAGLGAQANVATIALPAGQTDPVPGNNTSGTVTVTGSNTADLRVTKTPSKQPVMVGEDYNYTVSVRNHGPVPARAGQVITVVDTVPAGMTVRSLPTGSGWTCTPSTGYPLVGETTITCTNTLAANLAVNAGMPNIIIPVVNTVAGSTTNQVAVGLGGTGATDDVNNTGSHQIYVTQGGQQADLAIAKVASASRIVVGEELTYTLTATNAGPGTATAVRVSDALSNLLTPSGLVSVTVTEGAGTCSPTTSSSSNVTVNCDFPTLASGSRAVVTLVVKPANTTAADRTHSNSATVTSNQVVDPDPGNNTSADVTTTVEPRVDFTIAKAVTTSPVRVSQPLVYVITARNNGPSAASDATVTDVLPPNTSFLSAEPSDSGTCTTPDVGATSGTVTCTWSAQVNRNSQRTVTLRLLPLAAAVDTDIVNTANVTTTSTETDTTNNSATATARVIEADLDILVHKTDSVDPVVLGGETEYTVTVTNDGPSYGTNLVITDTFPSTDPSAQFSYQGGLTLSVAGTPVASPDCTEPAVGATSGALVCTIPTIALGESNAVVLKYKMRAESILTVGAYSGAQSNHVEVAVDEPETQEANNVVDESTTTRRDAIATDLELVKSTDATRAEPGAELTYTLTVTNHGPLESIGAQIIDTLPTGVSFVSSPDGCVASGSTVSCSVGTLAADGTPRAFNILVRLDDPYTGDFPVVNTARLDAPGDTTPGNNESSTTTPGPEPVPVPTLGEWALLALLAAMAGLGAQRLRRRSH